MRVYGRGGIAVRVGSGGSVKRTAGGGRTRTESKPASLWWAGGAGSSALSCELSLLAGACSHVDPATRCIHPSAAQVNPDHAQTPARTADMVLPSSRCCMVQPSIHHATRCLPASLGCPFTCSSSQLREQGCGTAEHATRWSKHHRSQPIRRSRVSRAAWRPQAIFAPRARARALGGGAAGRGCGGSVMVLRVCSSHLLRRHDQLAAAIVLSVCRPATRCPAPDQSPPPQVPRRHTPTSARSAHAATRERSL
jgi:hypothetical protein